MSKPTSTDECNRRQEILDYAFATVSLDGLIPKKGRLQQRDAGSMESSPSKNYWQVSMHEHAIRAAKKFDVWVLYNCQRDKEMTETATSRRMVSKFKFAVMQPIHCFALQFGLHGAGSDGNRFT